MSRHRLARVSSPAGFSLTELLVVVAMLAVVVAGVGSAMVSEMRSSVSARAAIDQQDGIGRARQQMMQEIALASSLSTNTADLPGGACTAGNLTTPLVLIGPGNAWRIAYGVRTLGPTNDWRGPAQLMRCGPPYTTTGLATSTAAAAYLQSVVLDGLPNSNGLVASLNTGIARDVAITLRVQPSAGNTLQSSFRGRVASNRLFSGLERCSAGASACESTDTTQHWRPSGSGTITGNGGKEDVIYFPNPLSSYTITSGCNRTSCTINGTPTITVTNGDVLVFTDQEIRLP